MHFSQRFDYGLQPFLILTLLLCLLLRLLFSAALGTAVGFAIWLGLVSPSLDGGGAMAVGAGLGVFYLAMPTLFTDRGLHWAKSALLRATLIGVFLAVALALRQGLELLALPSYPYLGLLADHQAIWRVPAALTIGFTAALSLPRFLLGPPHDLTAHDGPNADERVIRGPRFVDHSDEKHRSEKLVGSQPFLWLLGRKLPFAQAREGILIIGPPGSGKGVVLQGVILSFLRQAANHVGDPNWRCVITDVQNEFIAILRMHFSNSPLRITHIHPFSQDGCALDIAEFPRHMARELAMAFFPPPTQQPSESADFFYKALIAVFTACICGFLKRYGREWTGADLLEQMATVEGIREAVLWDADSIECRTVLDRYMRESDPELSANIMATVAAASAPYYTVFGGMREQWRRGQRASFEEFKGSGGVFVQGWSANHEGQMTTLHALVFRILRWTLLAEPESTKRATLVVVDELGSVVEPISDDLALLQRESRKRGVMLVLATHSTPGLANRLGTELAGKELLSLPRHVGILSLADPETAEWAASRLSGLGTEIERKKTSRTKTKGPGGDGESESEEVVREMKQLVSPAQLISMPRKNDVGEEGLLAYGNTSEGNVFRLFYTMQSIMHELPRPTPFVEVPFDDPSVLELKVVARPQVDSVVAAPSAALPATDSVDAELLREIERWAEQEIAQGGLERSADSRLNTAPHEGAHVRDASRPRKARRRKSTAPPATGDDELPYLDQD